MMMNRIALCDRDNPLPDVLDAAAGLLMKGELIVGPTETRYGLMARADRKEAMERMFETKHRPQSMATAVFTRDFSSSLVFAKPDRCSKQLAEKFLPGPLTLVMPLAEGTPHLAARDGKIGVRVSSSPFILGLLDRVPFEITATSANISGSDNMSTIKECVDCFGDEVALYIDSGNLDSKTSTVVECNGEKVDILREGAIGSEEIYAALEVSKVYKKHE